MARVAATMTRAEVRLRCRSAAIRCRERDLRPRRVGQLAEHLAELRGAASGGHQQPGAPRGRRSGRPARRRTPAARRAAGQPRCSRTARRDTSSRIGSGASMAVAVMACSRPAAPDRLSRSVSVQVAMASIRATRRVWPRSGPMIAGSTHAASRGRARRRPASGSPPPTSSPTARHSATRRRSTGRRGRPVSLAATAGRCRGPASPSGRQGRTRRRASSSPSGSSQRRSRRPAGMVRVTMATPSPARCGRRPAGPGRSRARST